MSEDHWQPIETAPRDGTIIPCAYVGNPHWIPLRWKTNRRIASAHESGQWLEYQESYFGDPKEDDDYEFALLQNQPTHWFSLPIVPEY